MFQRYHMTRIFFGICFCVALFFSATVSGQEIRQNIRGVVKDKDSGMPLDGATLVIAGTQPPVGTITDHEGRFVFEGLPVGRYDIQVSYVGYEPVTLHNVLLTSGKETLLNIALTESMVNLKHVVVSANRDRTQPVNKMATVSVMKFNAEEANHYAGTINDVARMVSSYAGVAANPSGTNDIIIRGNSPRGMGWRLEGLDIPNPNHFAEEGSSSGGISMLNASLLANSDFYTGAFPARYGNAYSGIFDMHLRDGNASKREYSLQFGFLGTDFTFEGPFTKKHRSSYLVNYRFSTLALFNTLGIHLEGDAVPSFQDITYKFKIPTKNSGSFTVFGVSGVSNVKEEEEHFTNDYLTSMTVAGFKSVYPINKTTYFTGIIAYTGSVNNWNMKTEDLPGLFSTKAIDKFYHNDPRISASINKKFNAANVLNAGVTGTFSSFSLRSDRYDHLLDTLFTPVYQSGATTLLQSYINWKHRFTEDLTLVSGIHSMVFLLNNHFTIEPRLGLRWSFRPTQALTLGFGLHSRTESLATYFAGKTISNEKTFLPNHDLDFTKALHFVSGYEVLLHKNLFLKTEIYYQHLYDVPVEDSSTSSFSLINYNGGYIDRQLVNNGTGRNMGIEVTLEKYFSDNYYFLITASLFDSKYRAMDHILRNTRYNSHYIFNAMGGKDFIFGEGTKKRTFSVNLKGTWAGGQWSTPIDLERSREEGTTVRKEDLAFTEKWKDFLRIDLKIRMSHDRKRANHTLELDIQNITNQLNVIDDYYDPYSGTIKTITQMGIVPILSYKILF